jgi:stringent starvation protein B
MGMKRGTSHPPVDPEMSSSRPYLIRAIHEWILDNQLAPHLLVNTLGPAVNVPAQYVQNGKIILNISPSSVHNLELGNDSITFSARFGGVATFVSVPIAAVLAIYARENGQGMVFNEYEGGSGPGKPTADKPNKPKLKLVT